MLNLMSSSFTSDTEFWPSTPYLGVKLKPQEASNSARMCNKWCGGFTGGLTRRTQQWNSSHANPSQGLRNPKWTGSLPVPSWPGCHTGWEGAGLWPGPRCSAWPRRAMRRAEQKAAWCLGRDNIRAARPSCGHPGPRCTEWRFWLCIVQLPACVLYEASDLPPLLQSYNNPGRLVRWWYYCSFINEETDGLRRTYPKLHS